MKIGIDYGDVITDTALLKSLIGTEVFHTNVAPELFKRDYVTSNGLLSHSQYTALQILIYRTKEFGTERLVPVDKALYYLRELQKDGHDLTIITTRGDIETELARGWLEKMKLDIPMLGVGVGNSKEKPTQGLDVFMDDELDELLPLGHIPHRFLFCGRYNRDLNISEGINKVYSWLHFYEEIKKLS
jgi:hypothetical protein